MTKVEGPAAAIIERGWTTVVKSWIDVSGERLAANYRAVQAAAPGFELMAVLKADAYGHGAEQCALVLAAAGAEWFAVTDLEEGERVSRTLRETGWAASDKHVVVLSAFEPEDAGSIVGAGLTPVVWKPGTRSSVSRKPRYRLLRRGCSRSGFTSATAPPSKRARRFHGSSSRR